MVDQGEIFYLAISCSRTTGYRNDVHLDRVANTSILLFRFSVLNDTYLLVKKQMANCFRMEDMDFQASEIPSRTPSVQTFSF